MLRFFAYLLNTVLGLLIPGIITHTWSTSVKVPGLATLPTDPPVLVTGNYALDVEFTVPPASTDLELVIATVDKTKIQSIIINADKVALDIFTNAANGTGGQEFNLAANKSVSWAVFQLPTFQNPITQNISSLWCNNPDTTKPGILRIGIALN